MWIGVDDTDSRDGGCTTFVCFELVSQLYQKGYCLCGYPRLIRLNPQVPWKTRGNGAIALQIGKKGKQKILFAKKNDCSFYFDPDASNRDIDEKEIKQVVKHVVDFYAKVDDEQTNPGFVLSSKPSSIDFYKKAVHELVTIDEAISWVNKEEGSYVLIKNGRGVIGAAAALSWNESRDHTFEIIAYRTENNWKTPRKVSIDSVKKMDKTFPSTFNNYDYNNQYNSIVPHSPCPILYGIRGDDVEILPCCAEMIDSEPFLGWMIFISNQGTDDHVRIKKISMIDSFQSVKVKGTVASTPRRKQGGHVFFILKDSNDDSIDCAAYEPTKQFRDVIQNLVVGDTIEVFGGIREVPKTINIEKIKILSLKDVYDKKENPVCPICKKHMKSKGKNQGYYCKACKTSSNNPMIMRKERSLEIGFYEVPVCARRHLSKPLKRISNEMNMK